jgi:hypothetical protein
MIFRMSSLLGRKLAVVALVVTILLLLAVVFISKRSADQLTEQEEQQQAQIIDKGETFPVIPVVAENGKFEPSSFTVAQSQKLVLSVTAMDDDYLFEVKGYPRLSTPIEEGETVNVVIEALGVGQYDYTCGKGCSGQIIVETSSDDED